MPTKTNYNTYFFFALLISVTILAFFIIKPFLVPFFFALVLVLIFNPVYKFFLAKTHRKGLSSLLTCLLIALIIIIPVLLILTLVVSEIQTAIVGLAQNPAALEKTIGAGQKLSALPIFHTLNLGNAFNSDSILSALRSFSQYFLVLVQGTYAEVLRFAFGIFVMFFSLFYMFIDGKRLAEKVMKFAPMPDKYDNILAKNLNSMVRATLRGTIVMAILHGVAGGLLFWASGVASPIFFGMLMAISSVIPGVGSGLVWFPVGITMVLAGHVTGGIVILLVGAVLITAMENIIRPKLIGKDTQMHPLLILFSTLGGIALFGISGFIIGPVVILLLVAFWDIYVLEFRG